MKARCGRVLLKLAVVLCVLGFAGGWTIDYPLSDEDFNDDSAIDATGTGTENVIFTIRFRKNGSTVDNFSGVCDDTGWQGTLSPENLNLQQWPAGNAQVDIVVQGDNIPKDAVDITISQGP